MPQAASGSRLIRPSKKINTRMIKFTVPDSSYFKQRALGLLLGTAWGRAMEQQLR